MEFALLFSLILPIGALAMSKTALVPPLAQWQINLGQANPDATPRLAAKPVNWQATASTPLVRLLSGSINWLLRLMGATHGAGANVGPPPDGPANALATT